MGLSRRRPIGNFYATLLSLRKGNLHILQFMIYIWRSLAGHKSEVRCCFGAWTEQIEDLHSSNRYKQYLRGFAGIYFLLLNRSFCLLHFDPTAFGIIASFLFLRENCLDFTFPLSIQSSQTRQISLWFCMKGCLLLIDRTWRKFRFTEKPDNSINSPLPQSLSLHSAFLWGAGVWWSLCACLPASAATLSALHICLSQKTLF